MNRSTVKYGKVLRAVMVKLLFIAFLISVSVPLPNVLASPEARTALVIGNGNYKNAPLQNPVNDATDIASALRRLGFHVTLKTNADQRTMKIAIRDFGNKLQKSEVGLFYYSGHSVQFEGRNYLIPINAVIETEPDVEFEAVDASRILGKMEDAGNKINILILDACRNNPYGSQFRSLKRGLAIIPAPQGTIVAYATAPGDIANDGEGRNGLYTSMLLKHISTPDLTIERFFKVVARDVRSASNNNQIPWIQSSLVNDFFFRKTSVTPKIPIIESAKNSSDISDSKVVARDGNFEKLSSGIVFDKDTGLEWYAGPDDDTSWMQAEIWATNLSVAGGGWRMPTKRELRTLYQKGAEKCNITPLLKITGCRIWYKSRDSNSAWIFFLTTGLDGWHFKFKSAGYRVFGVRSRSKVDNQKLKPEADSNNIQEYQKKISYIIRRNWAFLDYLFVNKSNLETRIMISIKRNGEITNIWIEKYSGNTYLDESAIRSIKKSNPLPPLPKGYKFYQVGLVFTPSGLN